MPAAARQKVVADSPENARYLLASELIRRWRTISGKETKDLAEAAHVDPSTWSTAAQGRRTSEETWVKIGEGLEWGGFLDYVMLGDITATDGCTHVDPRIRVYATERLRQIAKSA